MIERAAPEGRPQRSKSMICECGSDAKQTTSAEAGTFRSLSRANRRFASKSIDLRVWARTFRYSTEQAIIHVNQAPNRNEATVGHHHPEISVFSEYP